MAEGKGGKILHMTVKRARRVQEKMMQKLGKSDQTRDDVFEEFVNNFHKQNASAVKVQKEMTKYMNSVRVLYQNTKSLSETLRELYEEDWDGHEKQRDVMEKRLLLWEDLLTSLTSRTVEPMMNYISRFSDIKNRVQKRERKVVDYDLRRRELEHAKSKVKVSDQKVQQVEETFTQAKQLFDEITDELYEELPTFYDSRIQFYAQIFQSIAAADTKFHAEIAKIDEELAVLMDNLAAEAAKGVYSTKKRRGITAIPKLLSRPGEESDEESGSETTPSCTPSLDQSHTPSTCDAEADENSIGSPNSNTLTRTPSDKAKPPKPAPFSSGGGGSIKLHLPPPPSTEPPPVTAVESGSLLTLKTMETTETAETTEELEPAGSIELLPEVTAAEGDSQDKEEEEEEAVKSPLKTPPPKPAPLEMDDQEEHAHSDEEKTSTTSVDQSGVPGQQEKALSPTPENYLYTVIATHVYQGEDEDELSFEKGAIIYVVTYDDPDDEEEGWAMGVLKDTVEKGIFPENFTKKYRIQ